MFKWNQDQISVHVFGVVFRNKRLTVSGNGAACKRLDFVMYVFFVRRGEGWRKTRSWAVQEGVSGLTVCLGFRVKQLFMDYFKINKKTPPE